MYVILYSVVHFKNHSSIFQELVSESWGLVKNRLVTRDRRNPDVDVDARAARDRNRMMAHGHRMGECIVPKVRC